MAPETAHSWDELVGSLRAHGVRHLTGGTSGKTPVLPASVLIRELATSPDPRLRLSIIPLLITCPNLADEARAVIAELHDPFADKAKRAYLAAAAVQRMWRTRLSLMLGPKPLIPAAYLDELDLPSLDDKFGETTLRALAAQEEARYQYNAGAGYIALTEQMLAELEVGNWGTRMRVQ